MENKEKLELKYLAPYFPYGLKVVHIDYDYSEFMAKKIVELIYLAKDCVGFDNGSDYYFSPDEMDDYNPTVKPVFRPMSDLYEPILPEGKIPIIELAKIGCGNSDDCEWVVKEYKPNFELSKPYMIAYYEKYGISFYWMQDGFFTNCIDVDKKYDCSYIVYQRTLFEKLFFWHFDVFDLHSKGLCVYESEVENL